MNKTLKKNRWKNSRKNRWKNKTKKGGMYKRSSTTTSGRKMKEIEDALPHLDNDVLDNIYKFVIQNEISNKAQIFRNRRNEEEEDEIHDLEYNKRVKAENNRRMIEAMTRIGQDPNDPEISLPVIRQRREQRVRHPWWKQ